MDAEFSSTLLPRIQRAKELPEGESAKVLGDLVVVVRVVVRVSIAAPASVGVVAADVICMGLHTESLPSRSNKLPFCSVHCSATNVTVGVTFAREDRPRAKSCAVDTLLAE